MKRSRDEEENGEDVEKRVYIEFEKTLSEECADEPEVVRCTHSLRKLLASGMKLRRESRSVSRKRLEAWRRGRLAYATKIGSLMKRCGALGQVVAWRSTVKLCVEDPALSCRCLDRIVAGFCESDVTPEALVAMDEGTKEYGDLRTWSLKACKRWAKMAATDSSSLASCCSLLMKLVPPTSNEEEKLLVVDSSEDDCSLTKQRRILGEAWIEVLSKANSIERLKADKNIMDRVLVHIPDKVMPIMSKPIRLCDFFIAAFETEGVLALHGLFSLVVDHRLDYPDFFAKLIGLVSRDILYHKHRTKFLEIANLALRNAPSKVRKTFAIRLARAACRAPPRGIAAAFVVLADLKQRCTETNDALITPGQPGNTCLRALQTKHYAPVVRNAASNLLLHSTPPEMLEPFTYAALLAAEPKMSHFKKGGGDYDGSNADPVVPLVIMPTSAAKNEGDDDNDQKEESSDKGATQASIAKAFTEAAIASGAVFIDQDPTEPVSLI